MSPLSVPSSAMRRLGAASLLTLAACGAPKGDAVPGGAAAAPAVSTVSPENISVVVRQRIAAGPAISGQLAAEREATIRAQVPGPVLATLVDQGSRVRAGDVLARLDDRTLRDQFLGARSGATTAQTAADNAARELARSEKLAAAGAIAERELEAARRNQQAAQAQLDDARARLTLAKKQLDDTQVRAPFAGVIAMRAVSAGDVVQPGGAMFMLVDPGSMRLEASVPAAQLAVIRVGSPVRFTLSAYPGKDFAGKVVRINPAADPATGQVRLVATIPNARNGLVAGLFAEGRVQAEAHEAPVVGATAVDMRGVRPWVLRLAGGRAERVEVELGLRDEVTELYEVLKGVAPGDTLLVGAAQGITPGTPVRVGAPDDRATPKR